MYHRVSKIDSNQQQPQTKRTFDYNCWNDFIFRRYQRLKYQIDPEYLFSPQNGAGKQERAIVEEYFKVNYTSNFSVERITRAGMLINFAFNKIVILIMPCASSFILSYMLIKN